MTALDKNENGLSRQEHPVSQGVKPFKDIIFDDPKNVKKLKKFAGSFLTIEQIATQFGLPKSTFYKILERRPHLKIVIEQGKNDKINFAANKLMEKVGEGDTQAIKFLLERKGGFAEKVNHELSGTVKQEIELKAIKNVDQMTTEEQVLRLKQLQDLRNLESGDDAEIIDVEVV